MYPQNNDAANEYLQKKCPVCDNQEFEWGRLGGQVYYLPGTSIWSSRGRQVIRIRRCLRCNNLLQFTDQDLTRTQSRSMMLIAAFFIIIALLLAIGPVLLLHAPHR